MQIITNRRLQLLAMVTLPCLIPIICCLALYGPLYYGTTPFPVPAPYLDAEVTQTGFEIGGARRERQFEYVVERPLDEVQQYYTSEMAKYCEGGWQFTEQYNACRGYHPCRTAECEMPRPFVENAQLFRVHLWSASPTSTNVLYTINTWEP